MYTILFFVFVFTPDTCEFLVILFYSNNLFTKVFLFDSNTEFQYRVTSLHITNLHNAQAFDPVGYIVPGQLQ